MKNIYNILCLILGESKQGAYSEDVEQYQFNCCCCAENDGGIVDGKHNLEVLLSFKRGLKFHCWKCGDTDNMRGNIGTLIKRYGNSTLYRQYKEELESLKKSKLYDINLYEDDILAFEEVKTISLPKTYTKIIIGKTYNKTLEKFLKERGITQEMVDRYSLGYTKWEDDDWTMRQKLIIPSFDKYGELNFYVGRDYTNKSKLKYKNCNADKLKIVFQESLINWDDDIFLCEGAIDCLTIPNALSLLGKSLDRKSELYKNIIKNANGKVVICLDGDTKIEETKIIYSILNFGRLKGRIWYVKLGEDTPYKDFNDILVNEGKKGVIKVLRKMKQFNEIDLIW